MDVRKALLALMSIKMSRRSILVIRVVFGLLLVALAISSVKVYRPYSAHAGWSSATQVGVVVEYLAIDSVDTALLPGDLIISWSRGTDGGKFESPFDWDRFISEDGQRGSTILRGKRDSREVRWILSSRHLGVGVMPVLSPQLLAVWKRCRELESDRKFLEAAECWRAMISGIETSEPSWLGPSLRYQLAQSLVRADRNDLADAEFRRLEVQAQSGRPRSLTEALRTWGYDAFESHRDSAGREDCYQSPLPEGRKSATPALTDAQLQRARGYRAMRQKDWGCAAEYFQRALGIQQQLAQGSLSVAQTLSDLGTVEEFKGDRLGAEKRFQEALMISQKLAPGSFSVEESLLDLGKTKQAIGQPMRAEEYYLEALAIQHKLAPGDGGEASVFYDLGTTVLERGELARAENYFSRALAISERVAPGSLLVAATLNELGSIALNRGDLSRAEGYCLQALAIQQKLAPDSLNMAANLGNLGRIASSRGDLGKAEEHFLRALALQQKLAPVSLDTAIGLHSLASVAADRGDLAWAEDRLLQALTMYEKTAPRSVNMERCLTGLGVIAERRRDLAGAEDYYQRALRVQRDLGDGKGTADNLEGLGHVSMERGQLKQAEKYYRQALSIYETQAPGSLFVANSLKALGDVSRAYGEPRQAEYFYQQAMAVRQRLAPGGLDVAETISDLGVLAKDRGALDTAEMYFRQGLAIRQKLAPRSQEEAETFHNLGLVLLARGELGVAAISFTRAVDSSESQANRLGGTEEVRSDFRAKFNVYYRDLEDVLLSRNQTKEAYQVSERSRAQSLLHMLAERDLVFASDVPPDLRRSQKLNAAEYDRAQAQLAHLAPRRDKEKIETLLARMRDLAAEREQLLCKSGRVLLASPRSSSRSRSTWLERALFSTQVRPCSPTPSVKSIRFYSWCFRKDKNLGCLS
jgi:tetratricopeptide (TPR) repeat protein